MYEDFVLVPNKKLTVIFFTNFAHCLLQCRFKTTVYTGCTLGDSLNVINRCENSHGDKDLKRINCDSFTYRSP